MEIISSKHVVDIVCRTLGRVDRRLTGHGERVAGLALQLLLTQKGEALSRREMDLVLAALFHDVGAYKTDEIDGLLSFEREGGWDHAVYGYLFLKNLSPLGAVADAVLYHHCPYRELRQIDTPHRMGAALICLCDRVDVLVQAGRKVEVPALLARERGNLFDPLLVDLFLRADGERQLLDQGEGALCAPLWVAASRLSFDEGEKRAFLQMLAYSIDFRSECTVLHTITTVSVSLAIARLLGLDEDTRQCIYYGALLHDLGKVSTPVSILEKPGRLTGEEMAVMREHAAVTGEILGGFVRDDIYRIAVRHHEKLDGSGYPLGLRGEELSLPERVVAVADIVSALARERSYKEAFDRERVLAILGQMQAAGTICPRVTALVCNHYDRLMESARAGSAPVLALYQGVLREYRTLSAEIRAASRSATGPRPA